MKIFLRKKLKIFLKFIKNLLQTLSIALDFLNGEIEEKVIISGDGGDELLEDIIECLVN